MSSSQHGASFAPGVSVTLVGLSTLGLNGNTGTLVELRNDRWVVRLVSADGRLVRVLPKNLSDGDSVSPEVRAQFRSAQATVLAEEYAKMGYSDEFDSDASGFFAAAAAPQPVHAIGHFEALSRAFERHASEIKASEERRAAAPPRPLIAEGFDFACDCVSCVQGLAWSGPARTLHVSGCARCLEARYCSKRCQRLSWNGIDIVKMRTSVEFSALSAPQQATFETAAHLGAALPRHKTWCGKLYAPPRPLRLIHARIVGSDQSRAGGLLGIRSFFAPLDENYEPAGPPSLCAKLSPAVSCSVLSELSGAALRKEQMQVLASSELRGTFMSVEFTGSASDAAPTANAADTARLDAILSRLAPTRLLLIVPHKWVHADKLDLSRPQLRFNDGASMFDVSLFDTGLEALSGETLVTNAVEAMRYMFAEEDRLAPGGVRYEPGGHLHVGSALPPLFAHNLGATLDAGGRVISLAPPKLREHYALGFEQHERVRILPPRSRWSSAGPFRIGEVSCEDLSLSALNFHHPPTWPATWFTVFATFAL